MPDLPLFDAAGFFAQKIGEVEQSLISKKAELEILLANRRNLIAAISTLEQLTTEELRPIQPELASLKEVLATTERNIAAMEGEIEVLSGKLRALKTAKSLLEVRESP